MMRITGINFNTDHNLAWFAEHKVSVVSLCGTGNAAALRLVFTSDGVVVGVVIRRVERCDLVKMKPTESEAEH